MEELNVLIITPGHPGSDNKSLPPSLTAPYLAALITNLVGKIQIVDLAVQTLNIDNVDAKIAMLTTTMGQSDQIFDIAQKLKSRGVTIILGGPHATLAYNFDHRIKEIADSVILGNGEISLPTAIRDFKSGKLQSFYNIPITSLDGIPFSRLDLLDHSKYYSSTVIIGTRNCPNKCKYCSIRHLYGENYLKRPVDEIIEEIKFQTSQPNLSWLDRKLITFWDDNPAGDLDWFCELLEKMIPLKKWWLSQMCLNIGAHKDVLKLMRASGCKGIFVGLESVSKESLESQNKASVNIVENYKLLSKNILQEKISIVAATMYGFDQDTKESLFSDTLRVLTDMGVTIMQAHIVTPYPHSEYFETLQKENRLITQEAKYFNGYTIVHKPSKISPYDLQKGFIEIRKKFYSLPCAIKRMFHHKPSAWIDFIILNMIYKQPNYQAIQNVNIDEWLNYLKQLDNDETQ